jgi:nucleoside-diphosphate-sugar epimerase
MGVLVLGPRSDLADIVEHLLRGEGFATRRETDPSSATAWKDGVEIVVDLAEPVAPAGAEPPAAPEREQTTRAALEHAIEADVETYVLVSSTLVYAPFPSPASWPIQEHFARRPHGDAPSRAYGASCIAAEDAVARASSRSGLGCAVVRLAVVDGSSTTPFTSELRQHTERKPTESEARYESLGVMQWVDVRDAAVAIVDAALETTARGQAFNVAGAETFTVHDLVDDEGLERIGGRTTRFDLTKAEVVLGWEPRHLVSDSFPPTRYERRLEASARAGSQRWQPVWRDPRVTRV